MFGGQSFVLTVRGDKTIISIFILTLFSSLLPQRFILMVLLYILCSSLFLSLSLSLSMRLSMMQQLKISILHVVYFVLLIKKA
ncbi:hypothetical protein AMTRI_Chr04g249210 [Amborella trichopoda]